MTIIIKGLANLRGIKHTVWKRKLVNLTVIFRSGSVFNEFWYFKLTFKKIRYLDF
jgi:hypothetical protein